uniref:Uncharacterized protein n=1 Tax=Anguilla anguilla TaxID=7936 RepID=A0A0E9XEX7_ANGAN
MFITKYYHVLENMFGVPSYIKMYYAYYRMYFNGGALFFVSV